MTTEKPRILLKPKDASDAAKNTGSVTVAAPTQISIAARPVEAGSSANDSSKANRLQSSSNVSVGKDLSHHSAAGESNATASAAGTTSTAANTATAAAVGENQLPTMKSSIPIISDHFQIQNHVQDHLIETNTDFLVIGIIGTQGAGKSFILNMLIDDDDMAATTTTTATQISDTEQVMNLLAGRCGMFTMRQHSKAANTTLSNMPTTEGINMYITRHRTILLDCSPILCNPYKKEAIFNELDDLKMVIFLLSVCNTLIVIEDCGFNVHLMRLLMMAENMKVDVYDMDSTEHRRYTPNILIFKNKCRNCDFTIEAKQRTSNLYRAFFVCSGLKMTSANRSGGADRKLSGINTHGANSAAVDDIPDIFYFPWIDTESEYLKQCQLFYFSAKSRNQVRVLQSLKKKT